MDERFELPIEFNGKELNLFASLMQFGYSYKIDVDVNGSIISFERDEERNWRALLSPSDLEQNKSIDKSLIQSIVESLDKYL